MHLNLPHCVTAFAQALAAEGFSLYAVGGAVRNAVMGLEPGDIDITGPATPDDALRIAARHGIKTAERAKHYGTLVVYGEGGSAEYTTLRDDVYVRGHRPESVRFTTDIAVDARRRDFTVNAIYYEVPQGRLIDPLGGLADIERGILRATTADPAAMIGDDGLRMLRMLRFCGELNMDIDPGLLEAAAAHTAILDDIARERVWEELKRLLISDTRYPIAHNLKRALDYMAQSGIMARILPPGADIMRCAAAPARLEPRLAALLLDCDDRAALAALKAPGAVIKGVGRLVNALRAGSREAAKASGGWGLHPQIPLAADGGTKAPCKPGYMDKTSFRLGGCKVIVHFIQKVAARGLPRPCASPLHTPRCTVTPLVLMGLDTAEAREVCLMGGASWKPLLDYIETYKPPLLLSELALDGSDVSAITGAHGPAIGRMLDMLHRHAVLNPKDNNAAALTAVLIEKEGDISDTE